jgi:signal transduction histidine kinase
MSTRIRHWTLRSKVVLHVFVLGGLSAGILTVLYFTTQRSVLQSFIRREAEIVGSLIENSVFLLKKCGRVQDTQSEIHELARLTEAVQSIRILTPEGRIFASTRPGENDTFLSADDRAVLARMRTGREARRTFRPRPGSVIQSLSLVDNAPACYGCHTPDRKLNGFLEVDFDYGEASALLWRSQWKGMVLGLIALGLLTYIILRLFQRLINRPIRLLKEGMAKVQSGDLSVRWTPRKQDEIGSLMDSFNAMVANLQKANAEIGALYKQRLDKAEHLAAFGELAAGLAHEVKNPLSGMKGALEIISQETRAGDPHQEIFAEILVQIDKIIAVIQDFLRYARPKPLTFRPVPPNLFVENAVRLARTQVDGKEIGFHFHGVKDGVLVSLDADRMQEVLLNLLLNSIAAIKEKGDILILARTNPPAGTLDIIVADDGAGIPESHLVQLFHPFFSTKKGGTGLGLSICKKTLDAHQGTISVKSEEGKGTTFTVRLPLVRPEGEHGQNEDPDHR